MLHRTTQTAQLQPVTRPTNHLIAPTSCSSRQTPSHNELLTFTLKLLLTPLLLLRQAYRLLPPLSKQLTTKLQPGSQPLVPLNLKQGHLGSPQMPQLQLHPQSIPLITPPSQPIMPLPTLRERNRPNWTLRTLQILQPNSSKMQITRLRLLLSTKQTLHNLPPTH
jgi:hypothetical protein